MNKVRIFITTFLIVTLTGCQTMQNSKQNIGAIVGGITGALVGSKIGKGNGKKLAVVLGAVGGAWLGSVIGSNLDKQDQQAMAQKSALALDTAGSGQQVNWKSEHSNARATITTGKTKTKTRQVQVIRHKEVQPANNLELMGKAYTATSSANVRHMPSTKGQIVNSLHKGEVITAVGKVQGKNWIMVARDNLTIGYVYAPLLKAANTQQIAAQKKVVREPIDLSTISLDEEDVAIDTVTAKTPCRSLDYEVTADDGQKSKETFQACKAADGAWELSS